MPKIIQLSQHIANMIAAGEVVERPASVVKELMENAVDAGASQITVEIRDGGMTFLRITDNGCGMSAEDAVMAFRRHATSKLRSAEDLASITTMGFRGEALAAISSVSRIDLLTKPQGTLSGTSLHLEAGEITEQTDAGCPDGTTIVIRDLFYNTPARMKFMKSDSVEGSRVTATVQLQALAHPEVAIRFLRDGKQLLSTPGTGDLEAAVYCIYGRECAKMIPVDSHWEGYHLTGYVSRPTDARPSRNLQTFFVNDRPVKSRILVTALEEAYRNALMVDKFPACVLRLSLPCQAVDVNVHPAKTEVKFLSEKAVFDCVHYGVLSALNKQVDRPEVSFKQPQKQSVPPPAASVPAPKKDFFRSMNAEEYKFFASASPTAKPAEVTVPPVQISKLPSVEQTATAPLREHVILPSLHKEAPAVPAEKTIPVSLPPLEEPPKAVATPMPPVLPAEEPQQTELEMPPEAPWRYVGELYHSYLLVEQKDDAFLIDKHAAHERILFEKLKANQEAICPQLLLSPIPVQLDAAAVGDLLNNLPLLEELGFQIEEFGENTVLLRQIPMDLSPETASETIETLAEDLRNGRRSQKDTMRDELLHTIACKAAIKAGWNTSEAEHLALCKEVMSREDLKYCPHGRPICINLSKKQLEKQFKRS